MLRANQLADRTVGGGWLFSHVEPLRSSQGPLNKQIYLVLLRLVLVHLHNSSELHLLHEVVSLKAPQVAIPFLEGLVGSFLWVFPSPWRGMLRCALRSTNLLQYPFLILILSSGDFCVLCFPTFHLQAIFMLFFIFFLLDVNFLWASFWFPFHIYLTLILWALSGRLSEESRHASRSRTPRNLEDKAANDIDSSSPGSVISLESPHLSVEMVFPASERCGCLAMVWHMLQDAPGKVGATTAVASAGTVFPV